MALMRSTSSRPLPTASRSSADCPAEARPTVPPALPRGGPSAGPASGLPSAAFVTQRHLEVGLHDGQRRAQLVRGVGDEALLGGEELPDGPQRAPRVPGAQRADGHDDGAVERHELPAHATDRARREVALDLGLAPAGSTLGDTCDVRPDGQVQKHTGHDDERHDDRREQNDEPRGRAGEDVGTAGRSHAGLTGAGCSRRRAPS